MTRPHLQLADASVRFGERLIFQDLDLTIRAGEVLTVLGPNGRGKTTLVKTLVGALTLTAGRREQTGMIGYVPQASPPTFDFTVRDMVLMGRARHLGVFGSPGTTDFALADKAMDRLGIGWLARRGVATLSGGERQLVMIAQALAGACDLLILDEPASALDLKNQTILFSILQRLAHEDGLAIAFTTHVPGHALDVADQVLLLHETNRQHGPVAEIVSDVSLSALYGTDVKVLRDRVGDVDVAAAVALPVQSPGRSHSLDKAGQII